MFRRLTGSKWQGTRSRKTWSRFSNYAFLIGPSVFVGRVMGFLPFKLNSSKFVFWKLHFVYGTILITLFTISMTYSAYDVNATYKFRDTAHRLHTNILMLMTFVIFVTTYANKRSMNGAIQRISDISRVVPPKIFSRMTKIAHTKDVLLIIPLLGYVPILVMYHNNLSFFLIWYAFIWISTLSNLYTNNVYALSACFQRINESLERVKEILANDEPHLLRRVFHAQKNPMLLTILRSQKEQHLETSKIVHELNSAFGTQIEVSLFLLLIDSTFNIYTYLVVYSDVGMIKKFGYDVLFAFLNVIYVVAIILVVDITRSEMEKIGWNIHRILIHTLDKKMTMELEMFSLQVLQRGNTFTMKTIVLDFSYLTQVVCSITTLLLILIQFLFNKTC